MSEFVDGFVEREIKRIRQSLIEGAGVAELELHAAQQALCWALDPQSYRSPLEAVTGTPGETADCSAHRHLPSS